ncbi:hypothetical protein EDB83DRAFT_2525419 [Lactarius deliciosus]|nr:hypothetical protein EDB83DRAFT_2525419 [Lactarius deliciosus]
MVDAVGYHRHARATPAAENDDLLSTLVVPYSSSPAAARWRFRPLGAWLDSTIRLRHDLVAFLGDGAIFAGGSAKVSAVYALPPQCVEHGLASSRRQLEGPAGGLAARVTDPQLPVFAHAGNRVTASPTLSQPPIITIIVIF